MSTSNSQIFNGQAITISYMINNGNWTNINGTDASSSWAPVSNGILFTPLVPARGNLGWNDNTIQFMPADGTSQPQSLTFQIAKTVNVQSQIQIYLFWHDSTMFGLVALVDGQLIYTGGEGFKPSPSTANG